jgi:hypothetical protein
MESNDKYLKFLEQFNSSGIVDRLKAHNVASNVVGLNSYSEQIGKMLEKIKSTDDTDATLQQCKDIIKATLNNDSGNRIDKYIEFGNLLRTVLSDYEKEEANIQHLRKIANRYLDIAQLTKDEKVKNLAFAIADELTTQS